METGLNKITSLVEWDKERIPENLAKTAKGLKEEITATKKALYIAPKYNTETVVTPIHTQYRGQVFQANKEHSKASTRLRHKKIYGYCNKLST